MIDLRPYQADLVGNIRSQLRDHRRVLAVAPTGAGKTIVFVFISHAASLKNKRIVIAAHRLEIVEQISRALDRMGVRHGRIWPGNTQTADRVQVAMIQTLARRIDTVQQPDILVVDEAHHAVAGQYETVTDAWPNSKILGVTATPQRLDGRGLGGAFDVMVHGPSMRWLINNGFLAGYDYLAPPQSADFSSVKTRLGDYAVDQLAELMDKATITGDVIATYAKHLNGRPAICFCINVAHAEHVAEQFRAAGWRAASVDGSMEKSKRSDLIASIGDGRLNVLTSCQIISEGTDLPAVAGAILLRPTKSISMFLQSVGRALRIKPDGSRALVIDHVGNVYSHGMPCDEREWSLDTKKKKLKAPSIAQCETCFRAFGVSPNWKASAECGSDPACPVGCILNEKPAEKAEIKHIEGELVAIDKDAIAAARRVPLRDVLRTAKTRDDLVKIAQERHYKAGWVHHVMLERQSRMGGASA